MNDVQLKSNPTHEDDITLKYLAIFSKQQVPQGGQSEACPPLHAIDAGSWARRFAPLPTTPRLPH